MGKAAVGVALTEAARHELVSLSRAQKNGQALARRTRIVLAAAAGLENTEKPYPNRPIGLTTDTG